MVFLVGKGERVSSASEAYRRGAGESARGRSGGVDEGASA